MSLPRVVIVTRRYWPLAGGASTALADLAGGLARRGVPTTVLTPRWQSHWPLRIDHRGASVVRLPVAPRGVFGNFRYQRALVRWLRQYRESFDVVYVSQLRRDAQVAVIAGNRLSFPVVLRAEQAGPCGDCHWQLRASHGQRIKRDCFQADVLLAPSAQIEQELIAAGYPRPRICPCTPAAREYSERLPDASAQARSLLGENHPLLKVAPAAPLAMYAGPIDASAGIERLLDAWAIVHSRRPEARLWIVGDGPLRGELIRRVERSPFRASVSLPGVFDDLEGAFVAADLFVSFALDAAPAPGLLEPMAAGLPVLASGIPCHRRLLDEGRYGWLLAAGGNVEAADAICRAWDNARDSLKLARSAQRHVRENYSLDRSVEEHLVLFDRLLANRLRQVPA
ncbi:MAG: glycosyltransferase family 4 protein [Planctomycetia bacterium]|nr:glycosyltransferase family 4 protein [Planctomycetia bacterium]